MTDNPYEPPQAEEGKPPENWPTIRRNFAAWLMDRLTLVAVATLAFAAVVILIFVRIHVLLLISGVGE
jgi:hypothetical protein